MMAKNTNTHTAEYNADIAGCREPYCEVIEVRETSKFYIAKGGMKFSKKSGSRRDAGRNIWRGELIRLETLKPIAK